MKNFLVLVLLLVIGCDKRPSSEPYISGDGFRAYADYIFDETGINFKPENVKEGKVIFLKTDLLDQFFSKYHPKIKNHYILVTHNGDLPVPREYGKFLDDPKIIAWFGQNVENYQHKKLHPLPIGVANRYCPHSEVKIIEEVLQLNPKRTVFLYMNFYPTHESRKRVFELFSEKPFCLVKTQRNFHDYLVDLRRSKFVLSPRGNGLDCHRTWEALIMGAIPIVETSNIDFLFEGLPVIIVKNWEEVTEEFLKQKEIEFAEKKFNMKKIYLDYWLKEIHD